VEDVESDPEDVPAFEPDEDGPEEDWPEEDPGDPELDTELVDPELDPVEVPPSGKSSLVLPHAPKPTNAAMTNGTPRNLRTSMTIDVSQES
jgi:hypothetical protein